MSVNVVLKGWNVDQNRLILLARKFSPILQAKIWVAYNKQWVVNSKQFGRSFM